jgi:hypothetical protein
MSIKTKFAALAVAALTLTAGVAANSQQAEARNGAIGLGIAAGVLAGAAIAGSAAYAEPSYVYYAPRRCHWVRQHDAYGYYVGRVRVCNGY